MQFTPANGEIAINSTLKVSESATAGGKVSAAGGPSGLTSNKTTGTVTLRSAGGAILVNGGRLTADRGTIDVRNPGAAGLVQLNAALLAADVIKVDPLGTDGQLIITAGSQTSAATALKLYGGAGALGKVHFTGAGNVNIGGNPIHIAGQTVQIDARHPGAEQRPDERAYRQRPIWRGRGRRKFQNPVTTGPLSGAPPF